MESPKVDLYDEPELFHIIDKINQDFAELQEKYDELKSNHEMLQVEHKTTNENIKNLKKKIHNILFTSPNHRALLQRKGLNWYMDHTTHTVKYTR